MADFSIPPWLARDYNPVDVYVRSFQTGAQIGEERSRLAEQQRQANMDAMAKREALQANILRAQVELDVQKSYHDQQLALREQELAQEQARNEAMAQKAAADLVEREKYHQELINLRGREVKAKEQGRDYGPVTTEDIPGLPGVKGVYRPGSPGVHVIKPPVQSEAVITVDPETGKQIMKARVSDPALQEFMRTQGMLPPPATNAPPIAVHPRFLGIPMPWTTTPPASQTTPASKSSGKRFRYDPASQMIVPLDTTGEETDTEEEDAD